MSSTSVSDNTLSPFNHPSPPQGGSSPSLTHQTSGSRSSPAADSRVVNMMQRLDFGDVDESGVNGSDDEFVSMRMSHGFKKLSGNPHNPRFVGKSSIFVMVKNAMEYKSLKSGTLWDPDQPSWFQYRRHYYWTPSPWEVSQDDISLAPASFNFPEEDLSYSLVELYFRHVNAFWPLLHRPSLERNIADRLHLRDRSWAKVLLLVYALASRYSDDPRVLLDGETDRLTGGWKYFRQVKVAHLSFIAPPTLNDLLLYPLTVLFLQSTSVMDSSWTYVGLGVRLAQDVGAHRRRVHDPIEIADGELWKRAFWILLTLEQNTSAAIGKPCMTYDEDFDVKLPIDIDDEYWDPNSSVNTYTQRPGKPSLVTHFILRAKLIQIQTFALRTLYGINKSKAVLGYKGDDWERHVVSELDSALNQWVDSIPDHLRWDPHRQDPIFFEQSATLYAHYYEVQMFIHRPFLPSNRQSSPLSFPSLAICANAARSCIHVFDVRVRRDERPLPWNPTPLFCAGVILLLHIWSGKEAGLTTDPAKEMADVHKCMEITKKYELVNYGCGKMWDSLVYLTKAADLPLPPKNPRPSNKRHFQEDFVDPTFDQSSSLGMWPQPNSNSALDAAAGMQTAPPVANFNATASMASLPSDPLFDESYTGQLFPLPIHSSDLQRLPLFGEFQFDMQPIAAAQLPSGIPDGYPTSQQSSQSPPELSNMGLPAWDSTLFPSTTMQQQSSYYDNPAVHWRTPGTPMTATSVAAANLANFHATDPRGVNYTGRQTHASGNTNAELWDAYMSNMSGMMGLQGES